MSCKCMDVSRVIEIRFYDFKTERMWSFVKYTPYFVNGCLCGSLRILWKKRENHHFVDQGTFSSNLLMACEKLGSP